MQLFKTHNIQHKYAKKDIIFIITKQQTPHQHQSN